MTPTVTKEFTLPEMLTEQLETFKADGLRFVAGDILTLMKRRVHRDGLTSAGSSFTPYAPAYLRIRKCNNRGSSTKKIMSLTRELENSYGIFATDTGWAIGIVRSGGAGAEVGFRVSCIKKSKPDSKGKTVYTRRSVNLPAGATRKAISNRQKIDYLEATHGKFMTALSEEETITLGKLLTIEYEKSINGK